MTDTNQNQSSDQAELIRLLDEARPIVITMFPDQRKKWVSESSLAQEISDILARHPEYFGQISALNDDIFSEFKNARRASAS
jgi:hypothetical protein